MNKTAFKISSDLNEAMAEAEAKETAPPPSLKLYDIVEQLRQLDEMLDEAEGVLTDETEALLAQLTGTLDSKVDSICRLRKNRLASADACRAEIERLEKREDAFRRGAESLRAFLFGAFTSLQKDKVKTPSFTVFVKNGPLSVQYDGATEALPAHFLRFKAPEVDKKALLAAHEAGETLPDGVLVGRKQHLEIR